MSGAEPALKVGRVVPNAPSGLPKRTRLFHTTPPWVAAGEIFFITMCTRPRRKNQLANPTTFSLLSTALENYVQRQKLWAHLFLAMPDHLHALLAFSKAGQMDRLIRDWKRFVARATSIVWQDGFFDHRLRSDESFEEKAHYIRMNPVRAGLTSTPESWPYVWPAHEISAAR